MHSSDLYSLGRDNILKVWTLNSTKTKNLASRIPQTQLSLTWKSEITNKLRPG